MGRMDQFVLGMLTAIVFLENKFGKRDYLIIFPVSCVVLMGSIYFFHTHGGWLAVSVYKLFWPTYEGLIWAALIPSYIGIAHYIPGRISHALSSIGLLSYSFYLIHFIVISVFINHKLFYDFGMGIKFNALANTILLAFPIILTVSIITYHVIEKPFLSLRVLYLKD